MELIIAVIMRTAFGFCKETNEISTTPVTGALAPEYWWTGTRWLQGNFINDDELEKMRKTVKSKDSKIWVSVKSLKRRKLKKKSEHKY